MRKESLVGSLEVYFHAATLAAESNFGAKGFRQKDLRFLVELFANWMEASVPPGSFEVHNAQVARYLSALADEGFAQRLARGRTPRYRLNRAGILGILSRTVERPFFLPLDQLFFVHYFVRTYGDRIDELVREQGVHFPRALKLEIDALRDPKALLERQLRFLEKEIQKLEERIADAKVSKRLVERLYAEGRPTAEVMAEVHRAHPYKLNSQKPLPELFAEMPETMHRRELETGSPLRSALLWEPTLRLYRDYAEILRNLAR